MTKFSIMSITAKSSILTRNISITKEASANQQKDFCPQEIDIGQSFNIDDIIKAENDISFLTAFDSCLQNPFHREHIELQTDGLLDDTFSASDIDESDELDPEIIAYTVIQFPSIIEESLLDSLSISVSAYHSQSEGSQSNFPSKCISYETVFNSCNNDLEYVREICSRIPKTSFIQACNSRTKRIFKFFVNFSQGKKLLQACPNFVLDIALFIQYDNSIAQTLWPIKRLITKEELQLAECDDVFVGSIFLENEKLYHHFPSELSIKVNDEYNALPFEAEVCQNEEVVIVDRHDMIAAPNGARGGRPVHRISGQLLMTKEQVDKVFEVRRRWEGLSVRQRKDNVVEEDLYPFLTLNRDETAECLGACPTWLKDTIRTQGVKTWPGRPLRKTGAYLQSQKELLESAEARLQFTPLQHPDRNQNEFEVERLRQNIYQSVSERIKIVQENVSKEYFRRFIENNGPKFMNPDWIALPPQIPMSPSQLPASLLS